MPNWAKTGGIRVDLSLRGIGERGRLSPLTVLLHDLEELDNDLGGGPDHDLTLTALLGVVERVEGIVEDGSADHLGGIVGWRFSNRGRKEVSTNFEQLVFRRLEEHGECPR
jgi:hypothetical protein